MINDIWLPAAIRMGIRIEEFWGLNPKYMYMYQDNFIKEKEEQLKLLDVSAYCSGFYVQQAIATCFGKGVRYPKNPLLFAREKSQLSGEEQFLLYAQEFNKNFSKNQGPGAS